MNIVAVELIMTSWLTCTDYACIVTMDTVVYSNAVVGTLSKVCFTSSAIHLVIPNRTTTCTKCSHSRYTCGQKVAQLSAHCSGIIDVPTVIAHSAPFAIVVDLHTSFIW